MLGNFCFCCGRVHSVALVEIIVCLCFMSNQLHPSAAGFCQSCGRADFGFQSSPVLRIDWPNSNVDEAVSSLIRYLRLVPAIAISSLVLACRAVESAVLVLDAVCFFHKYDGRSSLLTRQHGLHFCCCCCHNDARCCCRGGGDGAKFNLHSSPKTLTGMSLLSLARAFFLITGSSATKLVVVLVARCAHPLVLMSTLVHSLTPPWCLCSCTISSNVLVAPFKLQTPVYLCDCQSATAGSI